MLKKLLTTTAAIALAITTALPAAAAQCTNDVWKKVMERGKIAARPANRLTPELRRLIRANRSELIRRLREPPEYPPHRSSWSSESSRGRSIPGSARDRPRG